MKKVVLLFGLLLSLFSYAQSDIEVAQQQLKDLKQSFILVRLKTNQLAIESMEEKGLTKRAAALRHKVYLENKETILSFYQTFDFCPVYFFYSDKSDDIRNGKLSGNVFNDKLELVDSDLLEKRPFFTAEFSETENLKMDALILMDDFLLPLKAPFPFYQRRFIFFSLWSQGKGTIAKRYNKKLHKYYQLWHSNAGTDS